MGGMSIKQTLFNWCAPVLRPPAIAVHIKKAIYAYSPPAIRRGIDGAKASPLGARLARGVFWSLAGAMISRSLTLAATVTVARLLGKTAYGELGIIQSSVGMFGVFAGFGLGLTATKHVAEFRKNDPERTGRIIAMAWVVAAVAGSLMAMGLAAFAPWLAAHTINAPHLAGALRIGAVMLFISALNGAQTGALAGFEAFRTIAHVNLLAGLLSFPILITGASLGGLTGAVWAMVINLGFNWLFNHISLRKEAARYHVPLTFRHCRRELPILWRFSLPAVLAASMFGPVNWAAKAILVNQPDGYGEMGRLAAALVFHNAILTACGLLANPLLAMLSDQDSHASRRLGTVNILSTWLLGLVLAMPLLCFPEIAEVLFGGDFGGRPFRMTFVITMFSTCVLTFRSGLLRVLQSKGLLWWGVANNLLWAIVLLIAAYLLAPKGAVGLATAFAIAYVVIATIFTPVYLKYTKVPPGLLLSKECVLVWLVLLSLVAAAHCELYFALRALVLAGAFVLVGWAMKRLWSENGGAQTD